MALTKMESERLAKVLALLDSDRDGEALSALRKARILLSRSGLSMQDLLNYSEPAPSTSVYGGPHAQRPVIDMDAAQEIQNLRIEIDGLRSALQNRDMEVSSLSNFRDESFHVLADKNNKIMALKRDLLELRKKTAAQGVDLPEDAIQLRQELAEARHQIEELRTERQAETVLLSRRESEIASLTLRLRESESHRRPVEQATHQATETRTAIARLDAEAAALRRFRDEALLVLTQRNEQVSDLRRRIGNLQQSIGVLRSGEPAPVADLRLDLERCEETLDQTRDSLHQTQESLHRQAREAEDLRNQVNTLRLALQDTGEERGVMERRLREAVLRLDAEATALRSYRDETAQVLTRAEGKGGQVDHPPAAPENAEAVLHLAKLEAEAVELRAVLAGRDSRVSELETELADLRTAHKEQRRQDSAKSAQIQAESQHLKTLLAQKTREAAAAATEITEMRAQMDSLKRSAAEVRNLRSILAARGKSAPASKANQDRIADLQQQITQQTAAKEKLAQQLATVERELEASETTRAELEEALHKAESQASSHTSPTGTNEIQEAQIRARVEAEILSKVSAQNGQGGSFLDKALLVLSEKNDEIVRLKTELQQFRHNGPAPVAAPAAAAPAGGPRTNAEKREAVLEFLRDPEKSDLSDREIARQVGVSPQTVSNWRKRLADGDFQDD
ncbi:helix-turn-helix domain-containing protein [Magnetospira thiophila]